MLCLQARDHLEQERVALKMDLEKLQQRYQTAQEKTIEAQTRMTELAERLDKTEQSRLMSNQQLADTSATMAAFNTSKVKEEFNPFLHIYSFYHIEEKSFWKTLWKKVGLLKISNFAFFHSFLCNLYHKILFLHYILVLSHWRKSFRKTLWKNVKLLKISNFTYIHDVFYAICILKIH